MFIQYKNEVENQLSKKIKVLRSDRGGENEAPFAQLCAEHGIIHQTTASYSPQQNRVAERKNRTLKVMINAMLISSGAPQNLWREALLFANYILNKIPHKKLSQTPYELWKGREPSYKYLKVWGCLDKVSVHLPKKVKLGPQTVDCIFIGYAGHSSAYQFLVHQFDMSDIHMNIIMESRNVSFFEEEFSYKSTHESSSLKRTHDTIVDQHYGSMDKGNDNEPRQGKRTKVAKSFGPDFLTFLLENEPQSYKEAMSFPES